ncbi:MAG TPA: pantetheine-phosphate adenylyltransferase [Gemmataceae bacterium]|nr:pantetheine-phosphate adenylyltransferase [Gemmataceae bacterium]
MSSKLSNRTAVYTGVFDPIHLGHLDVIRRGSHIFDHLVVGVGTNPDKEPLFAPEDRVHLVQQVVADLPNVEVRSFSGLAVGFVREVGAGVMLRGLRTTSDMEYEFTMSLMNLNLDPDIETVFVMAKEEFSHLSSSMIKQIASLGGALGRFLPPIVKDAVERRFREN